MRGLSVLPPKVPVACASTAPVGLGWPGNNQNGCTGRDCVPRLPRGAEPVRFRTLLVMVNSEPVLTLVTETHRKTPCIPWWSKAKLESSRETGFKQPHSCSVTHKPDSHKALLL